MSAQGIFILGSRPKSKKAIKEFIDGMYDPEKAGTSGLTKDNLNDPFGLVIEATSMFGNQYDGSLASAPQSERGFTFVGPDPYTSRKFYGTIHWDGKSGRWKVK